MLRHLGDTPQWYCGWDCILMPRAPGSNPSQGTRILQEVQQGKTKQNKKNLNYSLYLKSNAHDKMFKILLRLEIALYVCAQLCPIFCNHRDYSPPGSSVHALDWSTCKLFRGSDISLSKDNWGQGGWGGILVCLGILLHWGKRRAPVSLYVALSL